MQKLINGDCLEVLPTLSNIDLIVTSPPYNANKEYENKLSPDEYFTFTENWIKHCFNALNNGGKTFINIGWFSGKRKEKFFLPTKFIEICEKIGFKFQSWINWVKGSLEVPVTAGSGWGDIYCTSPSFLNGDEPILYFTKGKSPRKKCQIPNEEWIKLVRSPWVMPCGRHKEHPAVFPIELPERCIKMTTIEKETVLDPFMGTGTTILAAKKLNRNYIGIEKDAKYFEIAKQRLESYDTVTP